MAEKPPLSKKHERRLAAQVRPPSRLGPTPRVTGVAERVQWCAKVMAHGEWYGYPTHNELAEAWGCAVQTIRQYSAEAHRWLTLDAQALIELRTALALYCARIQREASEKRNKQTGLPDYRAALQAAELVAKFNGIELEPKESAGGVAMRVQLGDEPEDA